MTTLDYAACLDLAEIGDTEVARWRVIENPSLPDFNWEVCRDDDNGRPVMVAGCRSAEVAWNEQEEQASVARVRAIIGAYKATGDA